MRQGGEVAVLSPSLCPEALLTRAAIWTHFMPTLASVSPPAQ